MNICVFGASSDRLAKEYYDTAEELGRLIAKRGSTLIFGAGSDGMMGKCAEGAESAGGHIIGIAPAFFDEPGILYKASGELILTETMDERKQLMNERSDAFVALPGGLGTFDELFGCLTLKQLGLHAKPIILLNTLGYYDELHALIVHCMEKGFAGKDTASLLGLCDTPEQVMEYLDAYIPVTGSTKRICDYCR